MPEISPSPKGSEGDSQRDAKGRFRPGWRGGRGNPMAVKGAKIRAAMFRAITLDDVKAIIQALVQKARRGDVVAAREILDRLLGKSAIMVAEPENMNDTPSVIQFVQVTSPADDALPEEAS